MKKIVALVLCLVLALSLCTVAFGATTGKVYTETLNSSDEYVIKDKANEKVVYDVNITKISHDNDVADDGTVTYYATKYEATMPAAGYVFIEVAEDYATHKLLKDGVFVCGLKWLDGSTNYNNFKTTIKAEKIVAKVDAADVTCGSYVDTLTGTTPKKAAVEADGTAYDAEGTTTLAMYNGKMILVGAEVYNKAHTFTATSKFTRVENLNTKDVATVQCDKCKVYFKADDELPLKYDGKINVNYVQLTDSTFDATALNDLYVFIAEPATSTGSSSTTVESAKTFDAGIALYAGMALASVAGSAVVIGKKKEF